VRIVGFEVQDEGYAGEVETRTKELEDAVQPVDVVAAVAAGAFLCTDGWSSPRRS
jgi:hypothetical protein